MKSYKIVIIEDEELIREELKTLLVNAGYVVDCVINFAKTIDYIKSAFPDLILLDINLPEQDGYRLCSSIRSFSTTPILFITGRNTTMDELQALTLGGDDYITKPYNIPILLARINLLLRRGTSEQISIMEHNGIQFNLIAGTLTANGKEIELTKTELKIMYYLFKHTGEIVPRIDLVEYLWDNEIHIDDNTLSVNIMRIREKLRTLGAADFIQTAAHSVILMIRAVGAQIMIHLHRRTEPPALVHIQSNRETVALFYLSGLLLEWKEEVFFQSPFQKCSHFRSLRNRKLYNLTQQKLRARRC